MDKIKPMNRNDSIFYKLTRENENATTELLCNLLRSKYIRDLCLRFLEIPENLIESIYINNIHTQYYDEEFGIPDIVVKGIDYFYIIENKIRTTTTLTPNQKDNYINLLEKSKKNNKGLRFLVPKDYPDENITEITNKYDTKTKTWEEFLKHLYKHEIQKESTLVNEVLNYFCALLDYSSCEDTKLTPYEVAMLYNPKDLFESLKLMDKIYRTIKAVEKDILKDLGDLFSPGYEDIKITDLNGIGKYFHYNEKTDCIFVGLNLTLINNNATDINDKDKKIDNYIYSVAFQKNRLKKNFEIERDYFDDGDWIYISLNKKNLLSENKEECFKEEVIKIIKDVFLKNVS